MAQKIVGYVRFQVPAGKATPAPPVGPALGQYGVNISQFTKDFNERHHRLRRPQLHLHHQDAPRGSADQEGLRHRDRLRRASA